MKSNGLRSRKMFLSKVTVLKSKIFRISSPVPIFDNNFISIGRVLIPLVLGNMMIIFNPNVQIVPSIRIMK